MLVENSFAILPFDSLHDSPRWNLHPFLDGTVSDAFEQSIRQAGILHPPLVIRSGEAYEILCGRRRIQCARHGGQANFLCCVLPEDLAPGSILGLILEDQQAYAPLTLPEVAYFARLCTEYPGNEEVSRLFEAVIPPKTDMRFLLRLLEFDDELQRKIYTGLLNEKALFDLVQLDQEDRSSMVSVFESLQMGGNKQKRLLSLCRDITQREDISVGTLLAHPEIKTVIDHRGMNIPQKVNRLFSQLQKRAYPQSTTAQDFFLAQVQGLDLPASCTITPAPFFERDEVSLTVRFSNFEECRKYCLQIKDLLR